MTDSAVPRNTSLPAPNLIEKSFDSLIASPETGSGMSASSYMAMIAGSNLVANTPPGALASDAADSSAAVGD